MSSREDTILRLRRATERSITLSPILSLYSRQSRALHTTVVGVKPGEKRERDTGVSADIEDIVREFERLPASLVAQIILNRGDPLANMRPLLRGVVESPAQLTRIVRNVQFAYETPQFWQRFTTTCFPNVTRLPADTASWRDLTVRIFDVLASTTVTGLPNNTVDRMDFELFGEWAMFGYELSRNLTCSQLFDREYSEEFVIGQNDTVGIYPNAPVYGRVFSENFVTEDRDEVFLGELEEIMPGLTFYWEIGEEELAYEGYSDDGDIDGWLKSMQLSQTYIIKTMSVRITLNPRVFISDALFDRFVARNAGAYLPPPQSAYRSFWSRIVPPRDIGSSSSQMKSE